MPSPTAQTKQLANLNFYDALMHLQQGKKVTKAEWADTNYYGFMDGDIVKLHKTDGSIHNWILSNSDLIGTDWLVLEN